MAAGFRSPLFVLGLSVPAAVDPFGARAKAWFPRDVIYLDEDGNPVSLDEVKEAVGEAVEAAVAEADPDAPKRADDLRRALRRVLGSIEAAKSANKRDVKRLRAALKQSGAALDALNRAIEAQEDEEAAIMLILLH